MTRKAEHFSRPYRGRRRFLFSANQIIYGPHDLQLDLRGLSAQEVQDSLCDVLSVAPDAEAYLNGVRLKDKTVRLDVADRLEFVKPWGKKRSERELRRIALALEELASNIKQVEPALTRIADHFDPPERSVVGTAYIAERLGCTTKWIGDLVRDGKIPQDCICPKAGEGKYWRFWKEKIDEWIEER